MGRNSEVTKAGVKLDAGKSPLTMGVLNYFPCALLAVADVSAYGAKKYDLEYSDKNWMRVPNGHERYSDALGRHLVKEAIDPLDDESGLHHDAMAAWNALARLELRIRKRDAVARLQVAAKAALPGHDWDSLRDKPKNQNN